MSGRTCRREGCDIVPVPGQLACHSDWFALPEELRQRINKAWRRLSGGDPVAVDQYRAAVTEAENVWSAK